MKTPIKIKIPPTITEGYNTSLTKITAKIEVISGSANKNVLAADPTFFRTENHM